jgi:signal transduction histidine kinase
MVGTVQDVTPAKEAESAMRQAFEREREAAAQLRAADELKDEFLSNVSHELRTPLTPILGFSDLLLRHPDAEDGSHDDMIGRIHTNALSMQDLIGRLLDDSRLQAGRVELHLRPLGLRAEVERCLDQLGPLVGRDRVVVRVDGDARVLADPHALERILVNVVGNAAKFSPDRGTILIEARDAGSDVEVSVRDEGPGVAAGDEERIFERFFQGVRTRRGTGIGLSVARRYVEMLGGRIWAENRPQGGAAFSFTLPRAEGARNAPPG